MTSPSRYDTRLKFTKELLESLTTPLPIPDGFDPIRASNEDLIKYGLPPHPSGGFQGSPRAQWESIVSRPLQFIPPNFKISERFHSSPSQSHGVNSRKSTRSGAFLDRDKDVFNTVSACWLVPNVYPPSSVQSSEASSSYTCGSWVGIGNSSSDLRVGTAQQVQTSGGKVTGQSFWAWCQLFPALGMEFTDFPVGSGDLLYVQAEIINPGLGYVFLLNPASNQYTSAVLPPPRSTSLNGDGVEWTLDSHPQDIGLTPDYGAVSFLECSAWTEKEVVDLTGATLVSVVQDDVSFSTTEKEGSEVLVVRGRGMSELFPSKFRSN